MIKDPLKFANLILNKSGFMTFGSTTRGRNIGHENISYGTSSLIENVLLVDGLKY